MRDVVLQKNNEGKNIQQQTDLELQQGIRNETKPVKDKNTVLVKGVTFYKAEDGIYKEEEEHKKGRAKNSKSTALFYQSIKSTETSTFFFMSYSDFAYKCNKRSVDYGKAATSHSSQTNNPEASCQNAERFFTQQSAFTNHQTSWWPHLYKSQADFNQSSSWDQNSPALRDCPLAVHPLLKHQHQPSNSSTSVKIQESTQLDREPGGPTQAHQKAR